MKLKRILNLLLISCALSNVCAQDTLRNKNKAFFSNNLNLTQLIPYKIISTGKNSGDYQAVPDMCRLKNGDIIVVFYAGDNHVTFPSEKYPKAGRICLTRSKDEGQTWSTPITIFDDAHDNRDPHINQLSDGTIICSFFSLEFELSTKKCNYEKKIENTKEESINYGNNPDLLRDLEIETMPPTKKWTGRGPFIIKSYDDGNSWEQEPVLIPTHDIDWYSSAKVQELPDGRYLLPIYHTDLYKNSGWGGVVFSLDKGTTWNNITSIGKEANLMLAAETEVILLKDNTLYAIMRGDGFKINMHYSVSYDMGKSWKSVNDIGFAGHSPSFTRLKSNEIILSYRAYDPQLGYYTGIRMSRDEAKTWEGPYLIDTKAGAYPSTVELKDGSVLIVYYEEGLNSSIRAVRFRKPTYSVNNSLLQILNVDYLPLE